MRALRVEFGRRGFLGIAGVDLEKRGVDDKTRGESRLQRFRGNAVYPFRNIGSDRSVGVVGRQPFAAWSTFGGAGSETRFGRANAR